MVLCARSRNAYAVGIDLAASVVMRVAEVHRMLALKSVRVLSCSQAFGILNTWLCYFRAFDSLLQFAPQPETLEHAFGERKVLLGEFY